MRAGELANRETADDGSAEGGAQENTDARRDDLVRDVMHARLDISKGADLSVAEKALKGNAVSHGTSLSLAAAVAQKGSARFRRKVNKAVDEHPYAVFTFYYRKEKTVKSEALAVKREYDEAFHLTGDLPRNMTWKRTQPETVDLTDD
ncbi:hypothetical protein GE09DRAFT_1277263 [Coniochaeta sp. 2T2.1]|nr:hypothetical protein GE09DRAFT_1277263 [Coniochaeta sp. 2T2.1]